MKTFKVAGVQIAPSSDRHTTLKRAAHFIALAAHRGAGIVALPELFSTHWFPSRIDRENFRLAETGEGPTVTELRNAALKEKTVVIAPVFEREEDRYFNTAFVIDENGSILGKYRKMHIPEIPLWEEKAYFSAGEGFPVFKTAFATIGVQLCWDVFFPEGMRILTLKGARVVFAPTASAHRHSSGKWERAIQAAAHCNGIFVFRINRVGKEERQEFYGKSFCAGPDGEFVVKPAGGGEGIVFASIDMSAISEVASAWTFLKDRRPETYGRIVKK
jgi:N-carbamoylputrescine amidase